MALLALAGLLALLPLVGCGISGEAQPRALDLSPSAEPQPGTPNTGPAAEGATIYLISSDRLLRPLTRSFPAEPTVQDLLDELARETSASEAGSGLSTQVPPSRILGINPETGLAVVEVGELASDPVVKLALGQIVLTLTVLPGITGLKFFSEDGTSLSIPVGESAQPETGALTRASFADILAP